jgi:hypothetical protein
MDTPVEIRHAHFRDLFLQAQSDRLQIRSGLATPVAATAFTVFNLGTLAYNFEPRFPPDPVGWMIGILAVTSVVILLISMYYAVMAEWNFVHVSTPDLKELVTLEKRLQSEDTAGDGGSVARELLKTLTAGYYAGYLNYTVGNAKSSHLRTLSLRYVLATLALLALAFLLLPFHRAASGEGG